MKSHTIFIIALVCVLNVAVSSHVHNLNSGVTKSTRMIREISTDDQPQKCYDEFTLKTNAFLAEVNNKSLSCAKTFENDKSSFDLRNADERKAFQSFIEDNMKTTQEALKECSKRTSAAEYFQCVRSFENVQKDFLVKINSKSRLYIHELERIEHEKGFCLSKIVDDTKSSSAAADLRKCLQETSSIPQLSQKDDANAIDEHLVKLKYVYNGIWVCTNYGNDQSLFDRCLSDATKNVKLEIYLRNEPAKYFPILAKIDKEKDICLRNLAAQFIFNNNYSSDQLFTCLKNGREEASFSEKINDEMARNFEEFVKSIPKCNYDDRSDTGFCVDEWFSSENPSRFELNCYTILDENIDKLISHADREVDGSCLRYVLKRIQFNGVFMNDSEKEALVDCFHNELI